MAIRSLATSWLSCVLLLLASSATAQFSGFLETYPPFEQLDNSSASILVWKSSEAEAKYRRLFFDPPQVVLDPDSEYFGIRPDTVEVLSTALHDVLTTNAVDRGRQLAEGAAPDVLRVRSALTNVYLRRSKRHLREYNYTGFRLRGVVGQDVSLVEATVEFELVDSVSNERVGVAILREGQRADTQLGPERSATWSSLARVLDGVGRDVLGTYFGDLFREEPK